MYNVNRLLKKMYNVNPLTYLLLNIPNELLFFWFLIILLEICGDIKCKFLFRPKFEH